MTLVGANDVSSAEPVTFTLEYNNDNWVGLENVSVIFEYPEAFHPDAAANMVVSKSRAEKQIGEISSNGFGKVALSGRFYGYRGEQAVISAILRYSPNNLSGSFEKRVQKEVRVATSPLFFEILAPTELASDQDILYEIRYANNGPVDFPNLRVKLDYPEGFTFVDADPKPSDGGTTVWVLQNLQPRAEGKIIVRGKLHGERDQQKWIQGGIGFFQGDGNFAVYSEHERRTHVVASPFSITQTVNGDASVVAINPGEQLNYIVQYRNDGNIGIRDAILTVEIDSPYIDWSTLRFQGSEHGAYIQSSKSIIWKASDMGVLSRVEPGQGGGTSFSVATYSDLRKRFPDTRNLSIQSVAKIDSPDIPSLSGATKVVASSIVSIQVNTLVTVDVLGYYQDSVFSNSGPIPPVVGQETTYTIRLPIVNTFNDVENARVNLALPTGIRYTGKRSPESEKMVFNERSNELAWDIGTLRSGETRELVFQIGVVPDPGSAAQEIILVSRTVFTGKDVFTGQEVRIEKGKKTSNIPEDVSISTSGYNVQAASQ